MIASFLLVLAASAAGQNEAPRNLTEDDLKREGGVALTFEMVEPTKASPEEVVAEVKRRLGWYKAVGVKSKGKTIHVFVPLSDEFLPYEVSAIHALTSSNVELALRLVADRRKHPREIELAERLWPKESTKRQRFAFDGAKTVAEFAPYGKWRSAMDPAVIERGRSVDWTKTPRQMRLDDEYQFVSSALIAEDGSNDEDKTQRLTRNADGKTWVLAKFESNVVFDVSRNLTREDENGDRYVLLVHTENDLGEKNIASAEVKISEFGDLIIAVRFDKDGARKLEKLTSTALSKPKQSGKTEVKPGDDIVKDLAGEPDEFAGRPRLAIVVNERVATAPILHTTISAEAQITGFNKKQADTVAAGLSPELRLPCRLRLIETKKFESPGKKPTSTDQN